MNNSFLGDYNQFYSRICANLQEIRIDISSYALSHLGYKTASIEYYEEMKKQLVSTSCRWIENIHNQRPISKFILKEAIEFSDAHMVSLIELMPPKPSKIYPNGLEHLGVVLGNGFDAFKEKYQTYITGIQDQGIHCQPMYIRFNDGTRVKFYRHSLEEVVRLEGSQFIRLQT